MLKLVYLNSNPNCAYVSFYGTNHEEIGQLFDQFLVGKVEFNFVNREDEVQSLIRKNAYTCMDDLFTYHEPEDDLMVDVLCDDPEFNNIRIGTAYFTCERELLTELEWTLKDYAGHHNVPFILDKG